MDKALDRVKLSAFLRLNVVIIRVFHCLRTYELANLLSLLLCLSLVVVFFILNFPFSLVQECVEASTAAGIQTVPPCLQRLFAAQAGFGNIIKRKCIDEAFETTWQIRINNILQVGGNPKEFSQTVWGLFIDIEEPSFPAEFVVNEAILNRAIFSSLLPL